MCLHVCEKERVRDSVCAYMQVLSHCLVHTIRRCVARKLKLHTPGHTTLFCRTHQDTATPQLSFLGNSKQNYRQEI